VSIRYRELGEESEFQRLTDMMGELEKRDALVQKLDATTKLMVQAWHCRQCNTYSEHRPRECAAHALVKVSARQCGQVLCVVGRGAVPNGSAWSRRQAEDMLQIRMFMYALLHYCFVVRGY
jgi:hypothetical protein